MASRLEEAIALAQALSFAEQLELLKTLSTIVQQSYARENPAHLESETDFSADSFRTSWQQAIGGQTLPHDLQFPNITYRQGASGYPTAIIHGTGIRVQTIAIAAHHWKMSHAQIAEEYGLTDVQVNDALGFYTTHKAEIDDLIKAEQAMESSHG
jgi:uncharacterized protein (DUF433 family)